MAKVGRPKKNEVGKRENLTTTLDAEMKETAKRLAFERGISVGELFDMLIAKEDKNDQRRKKAKEKK